MCRPSGAVFVVFLRVRQAGTTGVVWSVKESHGALLLARLLSLRSLEVTGIAPYSVGTIAVVLCTAVQHLLRTNLIGGSRGGIVSGEHGNVKAPTNQPTSARFGAYFFSILREVVVVVGCMSQLAVSLRLLP